MKFSIDKKIFSSYIKKISSVVDSTASQPSFSCIYIQVGNDSINLTALNQVYSAKAVIKTGIEINREGKCLVNAKILSGIIEKMTDDKVEITLVDDKIIHINSLSFFSDINTMSTDDFVDTNFSYDESKKSIISSSFFSNIVHKILPMIDQQNANFSQPISGVLLDAERTNGFIETVGTDSYHLAYIKSSYSGTPFKLILNVNFVKTLSNFNDKNNDIECFVNGDDSVIFKVGDFIFNTRVIEGKYPSAIRTIENKESPFKFSINTKKFLSAIDRTSAITFTDIKPTVVLNFGANELIVKSQNIEYGVTEEKVEMTSNITDSVSICFNIKYLLDLLRNISTENTLVELTSASKPVYLKEENNDDYVSLLLPVMN
jgi:DNA polymerase-3 subunit beta